MQDCRLPPPFPTIVDDKQTALLTRRRMLALSASALAGIHGGVSTDPAFAQEGAESHGMSAFGDLKYSASFPHFDYADPKAPKGGVF